MGDLQSQQIIRTQAGPDFNECGEDDDGDDEAVLEWMDDDAPVWVGEECIGDRSVGGLDSLPLQNWIHRHHIHGPTTTRQAGGRQDSGQWIMMNAPDNSPGFTKHSYAAYNGNHRKTQTNQKTQISPHNPEKRNCTPEIEGGSHGGRRIRPKNGRESVSPPLPPTLTISEANFQNSLKLRERERGWGVPRRIPQRPKDWAESHILQLHQNPNHIITKPNKRAPSPTRTRTTE